MDALTLLLTRHSQPRLTAPAPCSMALENIKQAALRAPDHAGLKPWEFIVCTDEGLSKLGAILQDSAIKSGKGQESIDRALQLPHRAPMVIVAIAKYIEHEKVPKTQIRPVRSGLDRHHGYQRGAQGACSSVPTTTNQSDHAHLYLLPRDVAMASIHHLTT